MEDKPKEFCGIIGVCNHAEAAEMAYLGLYSLQHRGQESAGIISSDGDSVYQHCGLGLVHDVFAAPEMVQKLKGRIAIGHNRYSTTGSNDISNVQPMLVNTKDGPLALGHNGNLVNSREIYDMLQAEGAIFSSTTDSETILHLIARSKASGLTEKIKDALACIQGAYSLVIMTKDTIIAVRDPNGFKPLALGRLEEGYVVASETCAMDLIGAEYIRDVEPGEMLIINEKGLQSGRFADTVKSAHCIFEFIYFSRPDSRIFGDCVDKTRRKLGRLLAREHPVEADIVISVPDSSNTAALGFSNESGIKFELGLIRNHYIGRTFIQPQQTIRHFNVKVKFNPVTGVLKDKRIVVVEDSIVRGTTLKVLTHLLRKAGAKEVHIRVSSPPIMHPCYYGMDFPTKEELIATSMTVDEIREYLDVDSLGYLSVEGLCSAVSLKGDGYCTACFSGVYPVDIEADFTKSQHENLKGG